MKVAISPKQGVTHRNLGENHYLSICIHGIKRWGFLAFRLILLIRERQFAITAKETGMPVPHGPKTHMARKPTLHWSEERRTMDFIFMLTRGDQTILDSLEVLDIAAQSGVTHLGFKDVGVERDTLEEITRQIRGRGFTSYMEVVSTTEADALQSARTAVEIGVERLMGGTAVEQTLEILAGSPIAYYPFPGRPQGHPTRLGGSAEEIAADCRRQEALGCAGVDLLAYRAFETDPLQAVRAAREALEGRLVVAGSISTPAQIEDLAKAGADGFTIGSAVFDGSFSPRKGSLLSQLRDVLAVSG